MPRARITPDLLDGDLHVVGLGKDGQVIQVDNANPRPYVSAENLIQWGLHNLRQMEVDRLKKLDIQPFDRRILDRWHPSITQEENSRIAKELNIRLS